MVWWKFGKAKRETVTASRVGKTLSQMFDPAREIRMVRDWHHLPVDDPRPFLTVASLRIVGFRIGPSQESIVTRVDQKILAKIYVSFVDALSVKYLVPHDSQNEQHALSDRLFELANEISDVFYANVNSKPMPHWYVGKELCLYLQNAKGAPNPEEVMFYVEDLSSSIIATKKLFDDLLAAKITFVE